MQNTRAADAHLMQLALSRVPSILRMLPLLLTPSVKLGDFVCVIVGQGAPDGPDHGPSVSIELRADVLRRLRRDEERLIPQGRADALPVFVKDRGACHAFLLPIDDDHRRSLMRFAPGADRSA